MKKKKLYIWMTFFYGSIKEYEKTYLIFNYYQFN